MLVIRIIKKTPYIILILLIRILFQQNIRMLNMGLAVSVFLLLVDL